MGNFATVKYTSMYNFHKRTKHLEMSQHVDHYIPCSVFFNQLRENRLQTQPE